MSRCFSFRFKDKCVTESPVDIIPDEVLVNIFKLLPLEDLLQCENVCRRWKKVAHDSTLWRRRLIVCSGQLGEISENILEMINTHNKCIRCIKVQYILNYGLIKKVIDQCKNLTSLELVMCRIEKDFDEDIKKWPNLKKLNLRNSLLKSDEDIQTQFDQFKNLTYLGLSDFGLHPANCESLLNCHNLIHIHIEKVRKITLDFVKVLIKNKQDLIVSLHLYGGPSIDDECLFMLTQCSALEDLAIIHCEHITDKGLMALRQLKTIKVLQIWNNEIFSEIALMKTLECPQLIKLKSLSLSRVKNISPVIVDVISEYYKDLTYLALYQCQKIIHTDYEKQLKSKFRNIDVVLY